MSTETTVSVSQLSKHIELERFKIFSTSLYNNILAVGTDSNLVLNSVPLPSSPETSFLDTLRESSHSLQNNNEIPLVYQFQDTSSRISLLSWIDDDFLCVGFESGLLIGYSIIYNEGRIAEIFQFRGSNAAVQSIKLFEERGVKRAWILYEEGLLLMVSRHECY
jgi:hypothetical protein